MVSKALIIEGQKLRERYGELQLENLPEAKTATAKEAEIEQEIQRADVNPESPPAEQPAAQVEPKDEGKPKLEYNQDVKVNAGMFQVIFSNLSSFRKLIDGLSKTIDEGLLTFSPEGIKFRAMDTGRVSMVDFEILKSKAEAYETFGETVAIGIKFEDLRNWLKGCSQVVAKCSTKLILEKRSDDNEKLYLTAKGTVPDYGSINLLEFSAGETSIPRIPFNACVKMQTAAFNGAVKACESVNDYARITANNEGLLVEAKSDKGSKKLPLTKEAGNVLDMEIKEPSTALYSLHHLGKVRAFQGRMTKLEFSKDMPMRLTLENELCEVHFYLAPRIEEE